MSYYYYENIFDHTNLWKFYQCPRALWTPVWEPLLNPFIPLLSSFNHFISLPQSFRMESKSSNKIWKILYNLASTHLSRPSSYGVPILTSVSARLTSLPASALPLFAGCILLLFSWPGMPCVPTHSSGLSFIFSFAWNLPWKPGPSSGFLLL